MLIATYQGAHVRFDWKSFNLIGELKFRLTRTKNSDKPPISCRRTWGSGHETIWHAHESLARTFYMMVCELGRAFSYSLHGGTQFFTLLLKWELLAYYTVMSDLWLTSSHIAIITTLCTEVNIMHHRGKSWIITLKKV